MHFHGALAQLGEQLLCKHQVIGSIPIGSTTAQQARRTSIARAHAASAAGMVSAMFDGAALPRRAGWSSKYAHHIFQG